MNYYILPLVFLSLSLAASIWTIVVLRRKVATSGTSSTTPWSWLNFFVKSAGFNPAIFTAATQVALQNEKYSAQTVGILLYFCSTFDGSLMGLTLYSYQFPLPGVIIAALLYGSILFFIMRGLIQANLMGAKGSVWFAIALAMIVGGLNALTLETNFFGNNIRREIIAEKETKLNEVNEQEKTAIATITTNNQQPIRDSIASLESLISKDKLAVEAQKAETRARIAKLEQELTTARGNRLSEINRALAALRASLNVNTASDSLTGPDRVLRNLKSKLATQVEQDKVEANDIKARHEVKRQSLREYYEGQTDFIMLASRHWQSIVDGNESTFSIILTVILWLATMCLTISPILLEAKIHKFPQYKAAIAAP